jgi:glycosyltransferase involved in cell wall biosynthesis
MDNRLDISGFEVAAPRTLIATSAATDAPVEAVVCIPTFRRPEHLRKTLQSLLAQQTERRFAVVVVENDASANEGARVAAQFLRDGSLRGICVVEPRQGNCYAINAAFDTALAAFPHARHFLMIDDDELASRDWLELMVGAAGSSGADIVGGPVWPVFADAGKQHLERHPAFRPADYATGPVPIIYGSGNCLITRAVFERLGTPAFDLRFNFLGGCDVDFFTRSQRAGMKFQWVAEAVINETVPDSRTDARWLAIRALRIGAINYHVQRKMAGTLLSRLKLLAKVLALMPLSLLRAARLVRTEHKALIALHPMIVAAGGALAVLGIEPKPYAASKITS